MSGIIGMNDWELEPSDDKDQEKANRLAQLLNQEEVDAFDVDKYTALMPLGTYKGMHGCRCADKPSVDVIARMISALREADEIIRIDLKFRSFAVQRAIEEYDKWEQTRLLIINS